MKTLLNYPGAKWGMAAQIVSPMPPSRYVLISNLKLPDFGGIE